MKPTIEKSADDLHIPNPEFDPLDPHGTNHSDHGHHIIPASTLLGILIALLFFTFLTVFISQGEIWVQNTFDVVLPQWLNVVVAMSIATVKATLVCAYFMGLRFDKPLNTFVLLFCLVAMSLFLFFSMTDLGTRHLVTKEFAGELVEGGTGDKLNASMDSFFVAVASPRPNTDAQPIYQFRRVEKMTAYARAIAEDNGRAEPNEDDLKAGEKKFWKGYYQKYVDKGQTPHQHKFDTHNYFDKLHFGHHDAHADGDRSVRRTGLTPGLFGDSEADHAADHADTDSDH